MLRSVSRRANRKGGQARKTERVFGEVFLENLASTKASLRVLSRPAEASGSSFFPECQRQSSFGNMCSVANGLPGAGFDGLHASENIFRCAGADCVGHG